MATLIRPRSWGDAKPAIGSTLNRAHPLAQGLANAFLFNEQGGLYPQDLVGGVGTVYAGTAVPTYYARGAQFTVDSGGFFYADPRMGGATDLSVAGFRNHTFDCMIRYAGASSRGAFMGLENESGSSHQGIFVGLGGGQFDFLGNDLLDLSENVAWHNTGYDLTPGRYWHVTATFTGSGGTGNQYADGILRATHNPGLFTSNGSPIRLFVGGYTNIGSTPNRTFGGEMVYAYHWNRLLTLAEIQWLHAEPYAFVNPPAPKPLYYALEVTYDPTNFTVDIDGTTATLDWDASITAGIDDYSVFRRTPATGEPFNPFVDIPVASGITATSYEDTGLDPGTEYEWQVFGRNRT